MRNRGTLFKSRGLWYTVITQPNETKDRIHGNLQVRLFFKGHLITVFSGLEQRRCRRGKAGLWPQQGRREWDELKAAFAHVSCHVQNKGLLETMAQRAAQCPGMALVGAGGGMGGSSGGGGLCMHIADSLCCTAEITGGIRQLYANFKKLI